MRALLIKILLYFFSLFPLRITHAIATGLGKIIACRPNLSMTRVSRINIRLCFPYLSDSAEKKLTKISLIETCKTFLELSALWLWSGKRVLNLVQNVTGEECLQEAIQKNQGVILLTPHLGAWEMAGLYASSRYKITSLYRPPKLKGLHHLIQAERERLGAQLVPTDRAGIRSLYQALQRNEMIGILPDQVTHSAGTGVFAPFFGVPADTMILVSRLARKTGAPVIFTYAERLPQGQGFHLHFLPAPTEIQSDDVIISAHALNQGIENCVKNCPTQYQWSYKRFKHRPQGEDSVY